MFGDIASLISAISFFITLVLALRWAGGKKNQGIPRSVAFATGSEDHIRRRRRFLN
jgi:hypothetical protein